MQRSCVGAAGAVLLLAALAMAGCTGQSSAPDPAQVLKTRLAELGSARSVAFIGTLSMQGVTYHVTVDEDDHMDANGNLGVPGKSVAAKLVGGRLFLSGADYFNAQNVYTGSRWVLTHGDPLAALVGALADRRGLVRALTAQAGGHVSQRTGATINGTRTIVLANDTMTATVPASGGPPLRLATALDQQLSDGLADLKLDVTASSTPLTVSAPAEFVDLADKNTLPANFKEAKGVTDAFQFNNCDDNGCTLSDQFVNNGGRQGSASAMFVVTSGGKQLGSCTVAIPPTDNGASVRVGCRVNWDTTNGNASASTAITNPT